MSDVAIDVAVTCIIVLILNRDTLYYFRVAAMPLPVACVAAMPRLHVSFGRLVVLSLGCLVVWSLGRLVVWSLGCLVVWLFGCLVVWSLGCLVAW